MSITRKSFGRYLAITATATLVDLTVIYFVTVWLFHRFPGLHSHLSPTEAFFLEGLFVLVLGFVVVLRVPHWSGRDPMTGMDIPPDPTSHMNVHLSEEAQALGFALIATSIILFLMYLFNVS